MNLYKFYYYFMSIIHFINFSIIRYFFNLLVVLVISILISLKLSRVFFIV